MKTKIRKFLWFDITPRKELYKELAECYVEISQQNYQIESLKSDSGLQEDIIQSQRLEIEELKKELEDCCPCYNNECSE